jgi:hypothetical protein
MVAWFIGTKLFPDPNTRSSVDELMRTTGFAQTPGLLGIFAFIPIFGWLVSILVWIWTVVAVIVALRQTLDTSTARAIGIALLSLVVILVISLFFSIIGLSVMAL